MAREVPRRHRLLAISLFDGFVLVGALDLYAAGWLVTVTAVAGAVGGVLVMNLLKQWLAT